jgi:hypothetical protein
MSITIREVKSKKELKEFIYLPEKIHRDQNNWLPPIYMDEKKFFNPKKNLSFRGCDYIMLLAFKDEKPVGRIMGIINNKHNETFKIKNARFGYFDCYNDPDVSHALINELENWGRLKGMNKIVGPYGFTDRDIQGLLIKGFEYEPVVDSATNPEYLPELVVREGYIKELDCVIHRWPLSNGLPEVYDKIYDRIVSKKEFQFLEFTKRSQLKKLIVPVLKAVNASFGDIYGFMPMDEKEMFELANRYLPILDPRFVKIVAKGDVVAAFLISMPNLYKGIQKSKGRLLPFGIFHILKAMKTATTINTMLGGVIPEYQKQGFDVFLMMSTVNSAKKANMTSIDTHVVMEENKDMMAETKRYGSFEIKRFRIFQKQL